MVAAGAADGSCGARSLVDVTLLRFQRRSVVDMSMDGDRTKWSTVLARTGVEGRQDHAGH